MPTSDAIVSASVPNPAITAPKVVIHDLTLDDDHDVSKAESGSKSDDSKLEEERPDSETMSPPRMKEAKEKVRPSSSIKTSKKAKGIVDSRPIVNPSSVTSVKPPKKSSSRKTVLCSPLYPFTFSYEGERPILDDRRECARLLGVLGGSTEKPSFISDAERMSCSDKADSSLLKVAVLYNRLAVDAEARKADADSVRGGWVDMKKDMEQEMNKMKAEIVKARNEANSAKYQAAKRAEEDAIKMKDLEEQISRLSSEKILVAQPCRSTAEDQQKNMREEER